MDDDYSPGDASFDDDDEPAPACDYPRGWEPIRAFTLAPSADEREDDWDDGLLFADDDDPAPEPTRRLLTPEEFRAKYLAGR